MELEKQDLLDFLNEKAFHYNHPKFLETDPIQIPHRFSRKEDIEIAGFLSATIAWGQRPTIIANANSMMERMDQHPYEFITSASDIERNRFNDFVHRTFNGLDCSYFLVALQNLYLHFGNLEKAFEPPKEVVENRAKASIMAFRERFFSLEHPDRTQKHVANPSRGSSAKRLNMFLRWMVRNDQNGVDFGLWQILSPKDLLCPLDVHSGNVARKLGLLERKANDWKAVEELTANLRSFDPKDPVKYDFALFGLGVFEKF